MKQFLRILSGLFVLMMLTACSQSPLQTAVSAKPDDLAQAVNSDMDSFDGFVEPRQCIQLIFDSSEYNQILKEIPYVKTKEDVDNDCNNMFSKLANQLNENSPYKGLSVSDLKNKAFWQNYDQSQNAKFHINIQ